jgi:predicted dehydrogenase
MQTTAFLGVAHIHTPDFVKRLHDRKDVRCQYVYDHNAERALKTAEQLDAKFVDVQAILADSQVKSVIICSETRHHLDLVTRAAAAGKHIFVEKPLAITGEEAEVMAAAIEKAGVEFQIGFFQRSSPQNRFVKHEIEAGNLGTVTRMRHCQCHRGALDGWFDTDWRWLADKNEAGGGGFADLGAHSLDIILWCLSKTCGQAVKFAATLGSATHRYGDIDEWGSGLITFKNGAVATMEASWVDPRLRSPLEVHGTQGEILIRDGKVFYFSELVEGAEGGEWTKLPAGDNHAFELFWDKLEGKDVPLISVREAAEESRVMHELYKATGCKFGNGSRR